MVEGAAGGLIVAPIAGHEAGAAGGDFALLSLMEGARRFRPGWRFQRRLRPCRRRSDDGAVFRPPAGRPPTRGLPGIAW